jgi:hypothetical protein
MVNVTQPLPRWVMQRYSKLWAEFGMREFEHSDASKVLQGDNMVSIVLSALRKSGWMEVKLNSEDLRKRKYQLKNPEKAVLEISLNSVMQKRKLEIE